MKKKSLGIAVAIAAGLAAIPSAAYAYTTIWCDPVDGTCYVVTCDPHDDFCIWEPWGGAPGDP